MDGSSWRDLNSLALRPAATTWVAASGAIGSSTSAATPALETSKPPGNSGASSSSPSGERHTLPTQTNRCGTS